MKLLTPFAAILSILLPAHALNIAISSIPYRGHFTVPITLTQALTDAGHNAYIVAAEQSRQWIPTNVTFVSTGIHPHHERHLNETLTVTKLSMTKQIEWLFQMLSEGYETLLPPTLEVFEGLKPDVVVCDGMAPACAYAGKAAGSKLVILWPTLPSFLPDVPGAILPSPILPVMATDIDMDRSFKSRFMNFISFVPNRIGLNGLANLYHDVERRLGLPLGRSTMQLIHEELVLSWTVYGFDYPRMQPPLLKLVGPIIREPIPPVPQQYQDFIGDSHSTRLIIVSFGTMVHLEEPDFLNLQTSLTTLTKSNPNVKVIWALSKTQSSFLLPKRDPFAGVSEGQTTLPTNHQILYARWIPQLSLVAHPATSLFITHAGNNGIHEALYFGVPLLGIPTANDHHSVCRRIIDSKVGECLPPSAFKTAEAGKTIQKMMDPTEGTVYRVHAKKMQALFKDAGGASEAIRWIEWRARRDSVEDMSVGKYMELKWWEYYYLDVLVVIGGGLSVVLGGLLYGVVRFSLYVGKAAGKKGTGRKAQKEE
ncbi:UDP-glucuronosyltransferase 2A1 [Rhizophlyctis rosea]|nr:UDP-glucuronosyltransferase 2A1 [Rhizophlyctis rosea]